jgi:formate dehydrogenase major subunit
MRGAARLYATGGNAAIYYGLGVTEHAQGSTTVMGIANLAMATGNVGREGVGVNPLRGQNNVQGSCDMGSFPHELPGYRHISTHRARQFEQAWGVTLNPEPGLRIPNMFEAALDGSFKGLYCRARTSSSPTPTPSTWRPRCGHGMHRGAGHLPQRNRQVRPCVPAGLVLPGKGRHLHQRRAPHLARAQGDAALAGKADWEVTVALAKRWATRCLQSPVGDHGRDRRADAQLPA